MEIITYRESGEWDQDTFEVIRRARDFLRQHLEDRGAREPAMVLDIDDTSLSTYACLKRVNFERGQADCGSARNLPAIRETLQLFRFGREHRITVFFITGRRERVRQTTIANLRAVGFSGRWRLIMRPDGKRRATNAAYKTRERRRITAQGHQILANVGDQRSDLRGGYALRAFKLPNPMYITY